MDVSSGHHGRPSTRTWLQHGSDNSTSRNVTLLQAFEWYVPDDQKQWLRLKAVLPDLVEIGINHLWLPPGCKASGPASNGYDVYDLYDLGEFDWKMSRATKWGPKEDLVALAQDAQSKGVGLMWDAVLSHKAAADSTERVMAVEVDPRNRKRNVSAPKEIDSWVRFDFPARNGKYSALKYHGDHFSGVDYDANEHKKAIYRLESRQWATDVDEENGNFDYLMVFAETPRVGRNLTDQFSNVDYSNLEAANDVCHWGQWMSEQLPLTGMRLDAVRHISAGFVGRFMSHVRAQQGPEFFFVGEYWRNSLRSLRSYLSHMSHSLCLFDVPLVYNLARASKTSTIDLRFLLRNTLVSREPDYAVTCVGNHDTQLGQVMSPTATVERTFLPCAYAIILLRTDGIPCIFYGDLYGTHGPHAQPPVSELPLLCRVRTRYAYGRQRDYFDHANCIGWTREGATDVSKGTGLAVLVSNYRKRNRLTRAAVITNEISAVAKSMCVGTMHAGEVWKDVLGGIPDTVMIGQDGSGSFLCPQSGIAVWVNVAAEGIDSLDGFDANIYQRA